MAKISLIKIVALLVAIFLCVPVVVNLSLFDQALEKEVQTVLKPPLAQGPDDTYLEIVGLAQPGSEDWAEHYTRCTSRTQQGCLGIITEDLAEHPVQAGSELNTLLARYRKIAGSDSYRGEAGISPETGLAHWGVLLRLGGLNLAGASLSGTGDFIEALDRDTRFWGLLFRNSQNMIEKMVAVAGLWMNLQYVSEAADTRSLTGAELARLETILARSRLDPEDLLPAYLTEFRSLAQLITEPDSQAMAQGLGMSAWQTAWFLQPNATLNAFYHDLVLPVTRMAGQPDREAIPKLRTTSSELASNPDGNGMGASIYNPVGKKIVASAAGISDYLARVHDLNGMLGLVRYKLARVDNPGIGIDEFVDPIFKVNAGEKALSFECADRHSLCRISLVQPGL